MHRPLRTKLLVPLLGVGLALAAGEMLVRALPATLVGFSYEDGGFTTPAEFTRDATTNRLGFHDVEPPAPEPGVTRVLLLGDSYVAAESVSVSETVGQRLQHHLTVATGRPWQVISAGQNGDGQREELARLRALGPELAPDLVLCVFLSLNDVRNNSPVLHELARAQARSSDRVRPRWTRIPRERARFLAFERSALNQLLSYWATRRAEDPSERATPIDYLVYADEPGPEWEEAWAMTHELLLEMRAASEALGARFGVVSASTPQGVLGPEAGLAELLATYPVMRARTWDLAGPDRRLVALGAGTGIPVLLLEPLMHRRSLDLGAPLHWRHDGHWNVPGNDVAAEEIARFVIEAFPDDE